jgi:hypothetical protein
VLLVPACPRDGSGVWAAIDEFAPDVLVVDQQALAGAVVAERAGLPWATSATTSAELTDPLPCRGGRNEPGWVLRTPG